MDISTGNTRELVGRNACYPRWSPRGEKILFECYGEKFQVWITDTAGKNVKMLVNDAQNPAWSPDGKHFAFIRDFDLYTYNLKTGIVKRIFKTEEQEKFPAWSPDGRIIAFIERGENYSIGVIDLLSKKREVIATNVSDHISWTPQGQLLYDAIDKDNNYIIMMIDPRTKKVSSFNDKLVNGFRAEWINR
jgi:Tol biopolymer transport system component